MKTNSYIITYTGVEFDPFNPQPSQIFIEDIAHALSLECRFGGHIKHLYTVGQHCVNGTLELRRYGATPRQQFAFLMHDASEAYLKDMPRPIKKSLDKYMEIEEQVQQVIYDAVGLGEVTAEEWEFLKVIDDELCIHEGLHLKQYWNHTPNFELPNSVFTFQHPQDVESDFLTLSNKLLNELNR